MTLSFEIIAAVQTAKHEQRLKSPHNHLARMFEHGVDPSHVREALDHAEVEIFPETLEHHPNNRSPACTFLGWDAHGTALHVIVAYRKMLVVTAYEPTPPRWVTPREKGVPQ